MSKCQNVNVNMIYQHIYSGNMPPGKNNHITNSILPYRQKLEFRMNFDWSINRYLQEENVVKETNFLLEAKEIH